MMKNPDHDKNGVYPYGGSFQYFQGTIFACGKKKNVNCTFLSLNDFDTLLETSNYSLMNTIW